MLVSATPGPAKKRRRWPWVVGGVFLFIIVVGNLSDGEKAGSTSTGTTGAAATTTAAVPAPNEPSAPKAAAKADAPGPSMAGIGQPVRDGKFEFVVQSWNAPTGSISVTNIGDRPKSLSMSHLYLFDTEGRQFEPEFNWSSDLAFADLNPGQSVSGTLTYELSGATPAYLELHDSMFSGGAKVNLN